MKKIKKNKERQLIIYLSQILDYDGKQEIGIGSFAQVYKVLDKRDNKFKALRQISKKQQDIQDIEQQKQINQKLKALNHNNILKVFQIFEDSEEIYYLTEYCQGGSLWQALNYVKGKKFTEKEASMIVLQIAKALVVLHDNGIAHRDLKPENILLVSEFDHQKIPQIKLADFGLSTNKMLMQTIAGTKQYIAPQQVKKQKYTKAVDIWALGIIYDQLIHGVPFFTGQRHQQVFQMIVRKQYKVRSDKLKNLTKALLTKMLKRFAHERPKINQVIQKLTEILQTFEYYQRKKTHTPIVTPKLQKEDQKGLQIKSIDTTDLKKNLEQRQRKNRAQMYCKIHHDEIKLFRRGKKEPSCKKCLQKDDNIITIQEYLERLKLLNQEKKQKIKEQISLPNVNIHDFNNIVKNDKLSKQFSIRRDDISKNFIKLKSKYSFLNYSTTVNDKRQLLDKCKEELISCNQQYNKTINTCLDILLTTVESKIQKYFDGYFRDI